MRNASSAFQLMEGADIMEPGAGVLHLHRFRTY